MNRLEDRIRIGLQEAAARIPDTVPIHARRRARSGGPAGVWVAVAAAVAVLVLFTPTLFLSGPATHTPGPSGAVDNGWIAVGEGGDIWLVSIDQGPRRVIGTDGDGIDELCPAYSPDGRRLAYGRWEGEGVSLAVADVAADGRTSDPVTIELGDGLPAPCPLWSGDGNQLAFSVALTDPINPTTSAAGSEVWVVSLPDGDIVVLPDLLATDFEWSPDGSLLAIVSGTDNGTFGNMLPDGRIRLYSPASGTLRSIDATLGATRLTWSPDGRRIAYETGESRHELRIIDIETEQQEVLAKYEDFYGIGPVWSPDGEWVLYERCVGSCTFSMHQIVLHPVSDAEDGVGLAGEVVIRAFIDTADGVCRVIPRGVTWSPDGRYLLHNGEYRVGQSPESCGNFRTFLAAVPIDLETLRSALTAAGGQLEVDLAAVKLTEPEPDPGDPDGRYDVRSLSVPIQTWGIRPQD